MRICRSTSSTGSCNGTVGVAPLMFGATESGDDTAGLPHALRGLGRLLARNHPERGADRHADARGVSLAEYVSGHHLTRRVEIGTGTAAEIHRCALVDLEPEVRERDAGPQRIAGERWRIDRSRPVRFRGRQALGSTVVERGVI